MITHVNFENNKFWKAGGREAAKKVIFLMAVPEGCLGPAIKEKKKKKTFYLTAKVPMFIELGGDAIFAASRRKKRLL